MALSNNERLALNGGSNPVLQQVAMGDAVYKAPVYITAAITADATSTAVQFTIPFACRIVDIIVECTTASGSGA